MKYLFIVMAVSVAIAACSSTEQQPEDEPREYRNTASLTSPETNNFNESKVYVDSIKVTKQGLLIAGNLPDGCSKLHEASHTTANDSMKVYLTAWKPADKICTQALTPFTLIYEDLQNKKLGNATSLWVNDKEFQLN